MLHGKNAAYAVDPLLAMCNDDILLLKDISNLGVVLYTDGGCKEGKGGWGIHGYFYTPTTPTKGHGCKGFTAKADGYHNTKADDTTVTVQKYIDVTYALLSTSTNNEAELLALESALRIVQHLDIKTPTLILDSEYCLNGANTWRHNWKKSGWKKRDGSEIANVTLWQKVDTLLTEMIADSFVINWQWVKGHSDNVGNIQADECASFGVITACKNEHYQKLTLSDPVGYWPVKPEINKLFASNKWYFNAGIPATVTGGKYYYHLGSCKEDDMWGVGSAETAISIIGVSEPIAVLENVRTYTANVLQHEAFPMCVGQLNNILKPKLYKQFSEHGGAFVRTGDRKLDLYSSSSELLVRYLNPPRQAANAIESLNRYEALLIEWTANALPPNIHVTEITDNIYETVNVKNKSVTSVIIDNKPANSFVVGYVKLDKVIADIKLSLTHGIDIPRYAILAGVSADTPRVYVLTWLESKRAVRYVTVLTTEKEVSIWAGLYSNLYILNSGE